LAGLGHVALAAGDLAGARAHFEDNLGQLSDLDPESRSTGMAMHHFAMVVLAEGNTAAAVTMLSQSQRIRERVGFRLASKDDRDFERACRTARERLTPAEFERVWAKGRLMTPSEAVSAAKEHA
jgi:hypothetical protein